MLRYTDKHMTYCPVTDVALHRQADDLRLVTDVALHRQADDLRLVTDARITESGNVSGARHQKTDTAQQCICMHTLSALPVMANGKKRTIIIIKTEISMAHDP